MTLTDMLLESYADYCKRKGKPQVLMLGYETYNDFIVKAGSINVEAFVKEKGVQVGEIKITKHPRQLQFGEAGND